MKPRARIKQVLLATSLVALVGCEEGMKSSPVPEPRPVKIQQERSELSQFYVNHFARLQEDFLVQGLLRTDGGGIDVPFGADNLANNFMKIALFAEFSEVNGQIVAQEAASPLRRWRLPVVINVEFGDTLSKQKRAMDTKEVNDFARRLSRVSGHSIKTGTRRAANLHVLVLNEDERRAAAPLLRALIPGIAEREIQALTNITKNDLCIAQSYSEADRVTNIGRAVVIIRDEHPDLLRKSCIHEEIAQSLGLSNDSDAARPSIFNDDEEFGLLTTHDEYLLRILYDPRLRSGMNAATARPIVDSIARELLPTETPDQIGRI